MNERTVGLEVTHGHLQINDAEVVVQGMLDDLPTQVMNDGAIVNLQTRLEDVVDVGSQPDRNFAVVTFRSQMVITDADIYGWLEEAGVERPNVDVIPEYEQQLAEYQ